MEAAQLENTLPVIQGPVDPIINKEGFYSDMQSHRPVTNQQNDNLELVITQTVDPMTYAEGQGESSSSDVSAPPGFPIPSYFNHAHTV